MSMATQGKGGSLADVGRKAGVSVATASRVLNGSSHPVAVATRERVLKAAADLGYSPSALARALVTKRSRIIGVVVGDIVDPYFAEITRGVEDVAAEAGYMTIVCNADRRTERELAQLGLLSDYHAEGAVFAGSGYLSDPLGPALAAAVARARERGMEVVSAAIRDFEGPSIRSDNHAAAFDLTEYLVSLGHRRIVFIGGPEGLYASRDRLEGFRQAMAAAGLAADLVQEGDFGYDRGHEATRALVEAGRLPDAVIGANDATAIGALGALRAARVPVPERVSVAGMTDTRLARFSDMTTVSLPIYEFGAMAARRILGRAAEDSPDTVLAHSVVPRSTTAPRTATSP
jgi:LacI family transcriptional regulator